MTYSYDLSGTWQFRLDNEKQGLKAHYEKEELADTMTLPGTTAEQKKGEPNTARETGFLTEEYKTEGYAWFQKKMTIAKEAVGLRAILSLERTRISHVWVDGLYAGTRNSLCTSHVYDLTGYIKSDNFVITIMTSNTDYPTKGGHMTSPDTQTNWNGILGRMSLSFYGIVRMTAIRTKVDYDARVLDAVIGIDNCAASWTGTLRLFASPVTLDTFKKDDLPEMLLCEKQVSADASRLDPADTDLKNAQPSPKAAFVLHVGLPASLPDWDEYDPAVIKLRAELTAYASRETDPERQQLETWFGIRKFEARGTHFYINNRKTFLRGKHDGMIFPLTGYAPMNIDGWLAHMKAAKALGINHYRCHTCCPPEAAFSAADLLGIYYEPELPFWGTFAGENEEGFDAANQEYLTEEGFRICEAFGNHPSFCMMSMGNELWGNPGALNDLLGRYKEYDDRHLYTQGSNNFQWAPSILPNDDFFCGVRFSRDRLIRGSYAMCDAPQGHVQTDRPCTNFNYENAIFPDDPDAAGASKNSAEHPSGDGTVEIQYGTGVKRVILTDAAAGLIPRIPVISHEIGQYETYPNFDEIQKYTGVLKAKNLALFQERLAQKGLACLAKEYFTSSGALACACYKDELETAFRTKDLAGFQVLDIQDFSGQGTALVGVLDAFMENKGLISAENFREFCSDAVIQAEFPTYILQNGGQFDADISLAWYRKRLPGDIRVRICFAEQEYLLSFENPFEENGYQKLGKFTAKIPSGDIPRQLELTVSLEGTDIRNHYTLWSYPPAQDSQDVISRGAVSSFPHTAGSGSLSPCGDLADLVVSDPAEALRRSRTGSAVLLCLSKKQNPHSVEGTYCTDFWCYPMFRSISESMGKPVPVGTMGLLIRNEHPALACFPAKPFSTPQWWDIVMHSASTVLDDTKILPIVQTIDNFERNHRLGLLYEIKTEGSPTPILVCTSPLPLLAEMGCAEALWLLKSLCRYVKNRSLYPADAVACLSGSQFLELFRALP